MEKIYIKNKNMFKSKWQMVIYGILFVVIIGLFIYVGQIDFNKSIPDNQRFAKEFSRVPDSNVFKYATANDVRMIASGNTGIVLFGTKNEWVNYYADIVNTAAKDVGINNIYYYDFFKNRQDNNGTYEDIVQKLGNYVTVNDRGVKEIYAPTLLVMKNGRVLLFDSETAFVSGNTYPGGYWDSYHRNEKIDDLIEVFTKYLEA